MNIQTTHFIECLVCARVNMHHCVKHTRQQHIATYKPNVPLLHWSWFFSGCFCEKVGSFLCPSSTCGQLKVSCRKRLQRQQTSHGCAVHDCVVPGGLESNIQRGGVAHRSYNTSRMVAMDQAWVSQLNGQYWPFSLVNSGRPFQEDL